MLRLFLAIILAFVFTSCSLNFKMNQKEKIVELSWFFSQNKPTEVIVTPSK